MSYGIPVVGTRTGGIPELLEGGAGQIVPDKDPASLANAIERYVCDPEFTAEVARTGRQRICESFNVTTVVSQLLDRILPSAGSPESNCLPPKGPGTKSCTILETRWLVPERACTHVGEAPADGGKAGVR